MTDKLNEFKMQIAAIISAMRNIVDEVVAEETKQVDIILAARQALVDAQATHVQIADAAGESARAMDEMVDYADKGVHKYDDLLDSLNVIDNEGHLLDVSENPLYSRAYDEGYGEGYDEGYNDGNACSEAYDDGYTDCLRDHGLDEDNDTDEDEGE